MRIFSLSFLLCTLFACTKFETAKPTVSLKRSGFTNEFVDVTANFSNLQREKVLYYGIQFDSVENTKIQTSASAGLPCPLNYTEYYNGDFGYFTAGKKYYFRSFAGLTTGELLVSETLEFVY